MSVQSQNKPLKTMAALLAAATVLVGCGGGGASTGGDLPQPPAPLPSMEGIWSVTDGNGSQGSMVVLEDGTGWVLDVESFTAFGAPYVRISSVLHGSVSTTASSTFAFRVSGSGPDPEAELHGRDVVTGTFTPRSRFSTAVVNGVTATGLYAASYEQPAQLSATAGTYRGVAVSSTPATVGTITNYVSSTLTIAASGASTLDIGGGCTGAGTFTPRRSGKGVFDVSLQFSGPATCNVPPGERVSGIALMDAQGRLNLVALTAAQNNGVTFLGRRG